MEGAYDLTPGSSIGAVRLPGLELLIEPKLPMERVLFLVSYASGRWWTGQQAHARLRAEGCDMTVSEVCRPTIGVHAAGHPR